LIAPHETPGCEKSGLADAVRQKPLDLVKLLVAYGAEIKAVPFTDVLLGWEPRIIESSIMEPMSSRDRRLPSHLPKKSGQPRVR